MAVNPPTEGSLNEVMPLLTEPQLAAILVAMKYAGLGDQAHKISRHISRLGVEADRLQSKLKNYEPVNLYDGKSIDQWRAEALALRSPGGAGTKPDDMGEVSDGYHTFNELYDHRCHLMAALMRSNPIRAWRSRKHADDSSWEGWFIVGMDLPSGTITYHLPETMWPLLNGVETLDRGKPWDGHTSADVVKRLREWLITGFAPEPEVKHKDFGRWNFERTDDGFRICEGLHDKGCDCEWTYYVPKSSGEPGDEPVGTISVLHGTDDDSCWDIEYMASPETKVDKP